LQTTFFYDRLLIVKFLTLIAIFTTFSIKKALSREINRFSELLQKEGFSIMKTSVDLPKATKKRITQLLQILKTWECKKITSVEISNLTGWKTSLIRHDFWYLRNFQNQKSKDDSNLLKDSDNFFGVSNGYNVEKLKEYHVMDCMECGSCAYVCPDHRPLVQNMRRAKAELRKQQSSGRK
jgi:predicted aldo/keto reductase-like oxidoreductase